MKQMQGNVQMTSWVLSMSRMSLRTPLMVKLGFLLAVTVILMVLACFPNVIP